jgi:hypothetical protein
VVVRASVHYYNDGADLARLLDALRALLDVVRQFTLNCDSSPSIATVNPQWRQFTLNGDSSLSIATVHPQLRQFALSSNRSLWLQLFALTAKFCPGGGRPPSL